jgi:hypothetical protein
MQKYIRKMLWQIPPQWGNLSLLLPPGLITVVFSSCNYSCQPTRREIQIQTSLQYFIKIECFATLLVDSPYLRSLTVQFCVKFQAKGRKSPYNSRMPEALDLPLLIPEVALVSMEHSRVAFLLATSTPWELKKASLQLCKKEMF